MNKRLKGNDMRPCDGCTLCCKLLRVDELAKPQGRWCNHCKIGQGCKIYSLNDEAVRPEVCAKFDCLWRQGIGPEALRPDRSKVVMAMTGDGKRLVLHVDPSRPEAFRTPEFDEIIDTLTKQGMTVLVVCGTKRIALYDKQAASDAELRLLEQVADVGKTL